MKVTLGVLLSGGFHVPADFVIGYSRLQQTILQGGLTGDEDIVNRARILFEQNFPIDWARNHCVASFLDSDDGDYLLFLDADMIHPPNLAHRLVAHGKDIVSAHYVTRRPPHFTVAMKKVGPGHTDYMSTCRFGPEEGLIEIDAAGAGALLISRRCLQEMRARARKEAEEREYVRKNVQAILDGIASEHGEQTNGYMANHFRRLFPASQTDQKVVGDNWFCYQDGPEGLRSRSEDMWFFEQAKAAGFQAYLDADIKCQHLAQFAVDARWHEPWREANAKAQEAQVPA